MRRLVDSKMLEGVLDENIISDSFYPSPTATVLQKVLREIGCTKPFTQSQIEIIKAELTEELITPPARFPLQKNYYYRDVLILEWHAKKPGEFIYKSSFKYD
jgi:hypothetical protein